MRNPVQKSVPAFAIQVFCLFVTWCRQIGIQYGNSHNTNEEYNIDGDKWNDTVLFKNDGFGEIKRSKSNSGGKIDQKSGYTHMRNDSSQRFRLISMLSILVVVLINQINGILHPQSL